jgi:hypothetical protein
MHRLSDRVLALCQLGLCGSLEIAGRALRPELEQFFERGEAVACGRSRILTEGDPLQCAHVVGEVRAGRRLLTRRLPLDRARDLLQPLLELAGCPRTVVEEVSGLSFLVDEPTLIELAIDRLEDRDATSSLASRSAGENSNDCVSSLAISAARTWIRRGE